MLPLIISPIFEATTFVFFLKSAEYSRLPVHTEMSWVEGEGEGGKSGQRLSGKCTRPYVSAFQFSSYPR